MLGWNPGGVPAVETESIRQHLSVLAKRRPDWSEYLDASWARRGKFLSPGQARMQKRVCALLRGLGLPVRSVCASNVIFVRSRSTDSLAGARNLAKQCWPVHQFILQQVTPMGILAVGQAAFEFIRTQGQSISELEEAPAGDGRLRLYSARVRIGSLTTSVVSVPHLGQRPGYDPSAFPKAMSWVATKLGT